MTKYTVRIEPGEVWIVQDLKGYSVLLRPFREILQMEDAKRNARKLWLPQDMFEGKPFPPVGEDGLPLDVAPGAMLEITPNNLPGKGVQFHLVNVGPATEMGYKQWQYCKMVLGIVKDKVYIGDEDRISIFGQFRTRRNE